MQNTYCDQCGQRAHPGECGLHLHPIVSQDSCWFSDRKCPQCGSTLITNGRGVWCSFIGGDNVKACDYGIKERITVADWNRHWSEAIRRTVDEINEFSRQGLTRDDQEIWFRENMVEHMKTKLISG